MTGFCQCCPRNCRIVRPENTEKEGRYGICRCGTLPVLSRAGLHFWEEPCISGKEGAGAVFFTGCNLHCVYCQNYEISSGMTGKQVTVSRLREIYHELIAKGANNIDLVTPTHFSDAVLESLQEPLPVPVICNTNGYDSVENLQRFEGKYQIYLPDMKYAFNSLAEKYSQVPDYVEISRNAVKEMFRQTGPYELDDRGILKKGVVIRHLILPGNVENSLRVIDWVAENFRPGEVMFSLMRQYLPHGKIDPFPELQRKVTDAEYDLVELHLFDSGIEDGFVQEADSAQENFIPLFDGSGV